VIKWRRGDTLYKRGQVELSEGGASRGPRKSLRPLGGSRAGGGENPVKEKGHPILQLIEREDIMEGDGEGSRFETAAGVGAASFAGGEMLRRGEKRVSKKQRVSKLEKTGGS